MMILNAMCKFTYGQLVAYRIDGGGGEETHGLWKRGYVRATQLYQSEHFRKDAFMITYRIEPEEMVGFEHDDYVWVLECEALIRIESPWIEPSSSMVAKS